MGHAVRVRLAGHGQSFRAEDRLEAAKQITTQLSIPGGADEVWAVLVDLASYQRRNPFIRQVDGRLAEGAAWKAKLTIDGRVFLSVPTVIMELAPDTRLTRRGGLMHLRTVPRQSHFESGDSIASGATSLAIRF